MTDTKQTRNKDQSRNVDQSKVNEKIGKDVGKDNRVSSDKGGKLGGNQPQSPSRS